MVWHRLSARSDERVKWTKKEVSKTYLNYEFGRVTYLQALSSIHVLAKQTNDSQITSLTNESVVFSVFILEV